MLGGQLETVAEDHATIRYRSGSLLTYRCGMRGLDASVLWWSVAAIVGLRVAMQHNGTLQNAVPKRAKGAAPGRGTKVPSHRKQPRSLSTESEQTQT
jgi:hypothetical protein